MLEKIQDGVDEQGDKKTRFEEPREGVAVKEGHLEKGGRAFDYRIFASDFDTLHMDVEVPEDVMGAVEELIKAGEWKYSSFPNGSSYYDWRLPFRQEVTVDDAVAEVRYNSGICVEDANRYYWVRAEETAGEGVDLGKYFYNKDQTGLVVAIAPGSNKEQR